MVRAVRHLALCSLLAAQAAAQQMPAPLNDFLRSTMKLRDAEIRSIRDGDPYVRVEDADEAAEAIVFGVQYVNAEPAEFVDLYRDLGRLKGREGYLDLGRMGAPPTLAEMRRFTFTESDFEDLKNCEARDCNVQLDMESIEALQSFAWSSPGIQAEVDGLLQRAAVKQLQEYLRIGNAALGVYMNKKYPLPVAEAFEDLLTRASGFSDALPELHAYLVDYPDAQLANHEDYFYWEKVDFGFKPTLRVNHVVIYDVSGENGPLKHVIVNKQLWASHYFQSAFDLWLSIADEGRGGFYLLTLKASRQNAFLLGLEGKIIRSQALPRARKGVEKSLEAIKRVLE